MSNAKVVTRFAPSPTGFLHIGGARTALFNYYFAKRYGGTFRLRIEDTDQARFTREATRVILDGLDWLGLTFDEKIIFQSQNINAHQQAVRKLLESGHAYKCYLDDAGQDAERERSRTKGRAFRSKWRDGGDTPASNASFVVRFRVPKGETVIDDQVLGKVRWQNRNFNDLILLRTDGTPVYMLSVVVDDHDMGVTHIIRGDDHLTNAGTQKMIYEALGWNVPVFAHVPLIFGPDGKKLSKRHGALGVDAYADMGYIPAGLRNYLTRLGWAHGDMEVFSDEDVIPIFELSGINKSPARLDFEKMAFINGQHLHVMNPEKILVRCLPFVEKINDDPLNKQQIQRLIKAIPHLIGRAKTLVEFAEQTLFVVRERPIRITGKARKQLKPEAGAWLRDLHSLLSAIKGDDWHEGSIHGLLNTYVKKHGIGFGKIGSPLRACLTGGAPAPDLALVAALLGRDEVLVRVEDFLDTYFENDEG